MPNIFPDSAGARDIAQEKFGPGALYRSQYSYVTPGQQLCRRRLQFLIPAFAVAGFRMNSWYRDTVPCSVPKFPGNPFSGGEQPVVFTFSRDHLNCQRQPVFASAMGDGDGRQLEKGPHPAE